MKEEEIYLGTKNWFKANGYLVLAGQPAKGVDHLPVIEIKNPCGNLGSRGSYKPDMVTFKDDIFYIVECKPMFNDSDYYKLQEILTSTERLIAFYNELDQYKLFKKINYEHDFDFFRAHIRGVLAYGGDYRSGYDIHHLVIHSWLGDAKWS